MSSQTNPKIDMAQLNMELDKSKAQTFLGRNAAFFGPIMSQLTFSWTNEIPTAATDGKRFLWNPEDFLRLLPADRVATIEHEIQHVARLHMVRIGNRCPQVWNIACDVVINRSLRAEGHKLDEQWWIPEMKECPHTVEEDIYDWLNKPGVGQPKPGSAQANNSAQSHMVPPEPGSGDDLSEQAAAIVNMVVQALNQAKMSGQPGTVAGDMDVVIGELLKPVVPWQSKLQRFFVDMLDEDHTWRRPNRRFNPMECYLPSRFTDDGRLEHLAYYLDVSGSISQDDVTRFNSEVKYIKDTFNPDKMTIVTFDTRITEEIVVLADDVFGKLEVKGRGGTCLKPVRKHIIDQKPTAAIIFSDMYVDPMAALPANQEIPVIWISVGNPQATVPFGEIIHIDA